MAADLVRNAPDLNAALKQCRAEGVIALDTEFVWNSTYRPRLGLVQFGCRSGVWALDCLKGTDVSELKSIIEDAGVVKILHDARMDLQLLAGYAQAIPANVFDTQCAAAFADFPAGVGLQRLLFDAIGVGLAKTETLTDWLQRPLSPRQIAYALDDVRYLPALMDELRTRARQFGTCEWLEEELRKFDHGEFLADCDPQLVWRRIKTGRIRLNARGFAVLRAVAAVREEMAQEWNLPRGWLGDDVSLAEMANLEKVANFRNRLKPNQVQMMRAAYNEAIAVALRSPEDEWPDNPRPRYIREVQDAADAAMIWLKEKAQAIHVHEGAIASHATVLSYIDNPDDLHNPLSDGWRFEVVGRELIERFGVD